MSMTEPEYPYVVNPEAIGDPEQTPVVKVPADQVDAWRRIINANRRSLGLPPQEWPDESAAAPGSGS